MARDVTLHFKGEDDLIPLLNKISGGVDNLAGKIGSAGSQAGSSAGLFSKLGGALGNVATVAGGIVAANVFGKIAEGVAAFARGGIDAVGESQKLNASLNALFTSNILYEKSTEDVTRAVAKSADQIAAEQAKLANLTAERALQNAQLKEQQQRVWEMTNTWTDEGLATQTARAKLAKMQQQLADTEAEIARLTTGTTEYTTETVTSYKQVMDMAAAQKLAREQTKQLRTEIDKISVISPFEAEQVEMVAKYAVQAGMGVKATKDFTAGFLDLAAAVGISSSDLGFAADQLLQVQKIGKITTIDLRQLRRLGIDLGKVIGVEMGMSIEEFNAEAEKNPKIFDDLFAAVTRFSQNTFAGTAQEMSTSVKGLQSQLADLFKIGARDFFTPLVEGASPFANDLIGRLSSAFLGGQMKQLGQQVADQLFVAFQPGGAQQLIVQLGTVLQDAWNANVQPVLDRWAEQAVAWVLQAIPRIPEYLNQLVANLTSYFSNQAPQLLASTAGWVDTIFAWVNEAVNRVGEFLGVLLLAVATWLGSGDTQAQLFEMGNALGQLLFDGISNLLQDQEQFTKLLVKIAGGLAAGVVAVTALIVAIGAQIVAGIIAGIAEKLGADLQPFTLNELITLLNDIGQKMPEIAAYVGRSIMDGIRQGIEQNVEKVKSFLKGIMDDILTSAKEAIGFGSPAKAFIPVGQSMTQGLQAGLMAGAPDLLSTFDKLFGQVSMESISNIIGGPDELERSLKKKLSGTRTKFVLDQFKEAARASQQFFAGPTKNMDKAIEVLTRAANWEKAGVDINIEAAAKQFYEGVQKGIAQAEQVYAAAQEGRLKQMVDFGGKLVDFVTTAYGTAKDRVKEFVDLLNRGGEFAFEGQVYDQVTAQEKLNDLLGEQRGIQEDIARLGEQRQQLDFLKEQVNLMQMARDAGLNLRDLFGDVALGINASQADLVHATSNVLQALIGQANAELQIGSPSKVMKRIGEQTMAGMAAGLEAGRQQMGLSTGGTPGNVVAHTWNVTINTNGGAGAVVQSLQALTALSGTGA